MIFRISVLVASIFLIVGCQQDDTENSLPTQEQDQDERIINVKNSDPREKRDLTNEQIADHLANVASDVPEVDDAVAIVAGPYAVVGIDVQQELDRSRVGTIKYSVLEALQHDPYGKTAVVVADGDVNERIRLMAEKMRQGHPVQGIVDEVSAIVGRYMPDFPIPEDQPETPDINKEILDKENEEDNLDDIQNEQSKNHKEQRED
ncbi:YhcN/YlaJ family sporulation lipoprotein [Ornithinibacillus sp. L9]|uniref:YhcN/YlaJ family sporulation lipoprotein n=1 Tax=Ornithinibacillus caprae TaxID=2678566 RepID=A0A6N8FIZ3_9BACI|nr:YhcN/YlaJ family sporulation lipoprotein [Ornithinibacillus caprae]MUK89570.1 YhcN/YlaJ family sporulation lipoprotein [Ornithinibacillus caprae]